VIADVSAPALYEHLLPEDAAPRRARLVRERFEWDLATLKLDWALSEPIPWTDPDVGLAGTVHIGSTMDELRRTSWQLGAGRIPDAMFLLIGQMTTTDPTRSPAGTESAWAYMHLPHRVVVDDGAGPGRRTLTGTWDEGELAELVSRVEERLEEFAPGFASRILARHVAGPHELERANPNLVGGAVGGGTSALHQQLVFRPAPGTGRPSTGVAGLYLASAAAHPGGGVHGVGGANAARAARWGALGSRLTRR
jgi:phytoene dehydrogenase-like protein